jgi:hypothetical protein
MTTEYFTFEIQDGRATSGLMRRVRSDDGERLELLAENEWVNKPDLIRHFVEGDIVPITRTEAEAVADGYGGRL